MVPSGFSITANEFTPMNNTVMFEWNSSQGRGSQLVVEYYRITISPPPLSPPNSIINVNNSFLLNVTLNYNTVYNATITAINCAGESQTATLSGIEFGENCIIISALLVVC